MKTLYMVFLVAFTLIGLPFTMAQQEEQKKPSKVVYLITLEGEIDDGLSKEVTSKLQKVEVDKAAAILLEIDTPGGDVACTFQICAEIDRLSGQEGVPVYCYVLNKALSGGALVALACDKIYMRKTSVIGDAKVITMSPFQGVQNADEKFVAPVRQKFIAYAQARNYPEALAQAMVDAEMEVKEIEYEGKRYFKTPEQIQDMMRDPTIDRDEIREVQTVVRQGELATFSAPKAQDYGFCQGGIYEKREEVLKDLKLEQYPLEELSVTSTEALANFLTNKFVVFLLITLGILGIAIELVTPGFGIPGILGLTCLALFFVGGYLADATAIWEIVLFIVGVALLAIEVFTIPGFGIVGITGLICCFSALLLSLQAFNIPETPQEIDAFMLNLFTLTMGIGVDVAAIFLLSRFLPESAPLQRLSVATVQRTEEGYTVAISELARLLHQEGTAVSPLRPAGRIEIGGNTYDALTQGDFIKVGEKLRVFEVQGNRIIVEKVRIS